MVPGLTQQLPESVDRTPLGEPQWFGGHLKHDLVHGYDDPADRIHFDDLL